MPKFLTQFSWRWLLVGALVALLAVAAACGDDDDDDDDDGPTDTTTTAPTDGEVDALAAMFFPETGRVALREAIEQGIIDQFLFVDGTKSQSMFDDIGVENFEGMSGTQPGSPNEAFAAAFTAAGGDPDAPFVRESYDAAYALALAAVAANSTAGADIAAHLPFIANPPGEEVGFGAAEFTRAIGLLADGEDINFVGASGPVDFDVNGDLASGAVEIWKIVDGVITFQEARTADVAGQAGVEVPAGTLSPAATAPTGALKLGTIVAITGDLSDFGPPIEAAIDLAISEINAGGGVFGLDVEVANGDSATNADTGQSEATRLIEIEGVHAIIGALSSGVTQPIAENVAAPAGIVMISPASTAPAITTADDDGLLFRTPIADVAQGEVLANLALDLGFTTVCTLFVNTAYGQGLSEAFKLNFEAGGGSVPQEVAIEQEQTSYVTELRRCVGE